MDNETLNRLVAQISAVERVTALLLAEQLKQLPLGDQAVLRATVASKMEPPQAADLAVADDLAGRAIEYDLVTARILQTALVVANLPEGQTTQG